MAERISSVETKLDYITKQLESLDRKVDAISDWRIRVMATAAVISLITGAVFSLIGILLSPTIFGWLKSLL